MFLLPGCFGIQYSVAHISLAGYQLRNNVQQLCCIIVKRQCDSCLQWIVQMNHSLYNIPLILGCAQVQAKVAQAAAHYGWAAPLKEIFFFNFVFSLHKLMHFHHELVHKYSPECRKLTLWCSKICPRTPTSNVSPLLLTFNLLTLIFNIKLGRCALFSLSNCPYRSMCAFLHLLQGNLLKKSVIWHKMLI